MTRPQWCPMAFRYEDQIFRADVVNNGVCFGHWVLNIEIYL